MSRAVVVEPPAPSGAAEPAEAAGATLSSRVRRGAMWSGASTILIKIANIAVMAIVVRLVTPSEFGVFAVAMSVYAIVASASELGAIAVLGRGDTDVEAVAPTVGAVAVVSSAVLAAAMFAGAAPLAAALGSPGAAAPIRILSLVVLSTGLFGVPAAMLGREFRQDRVFIANLLAFVPSNALLIVLAQVGDGATAFAWSRVLGQCVVGAGLIAFASRRFAFGFDRSAFRHVMSIGLPLAGANLVAFVMLNADYVFVSRSLGPVQLGIYVLAFNVAGWSSVLLAAMINSVAMPAFSRVVHDPDRHDHLLRRANQAVAALACPVAAVTVASAYPLVEVVYGRTWTPSAAVLQVLAVYGAVYGLALLFANVLAGSGRQARALLWIHLVWIGLLVPAMYGGLALWGVRGVAVAHVVVICLVVLPAYALAFRRQGLARSGVLRPAIPFVLAGVVAGLADAAVSSLVAATVAKLLLGAAAGLLTYLLLAGRRAASLAPQHGRVARLLTRSSAAAGLLDPVSWSARRSSRRARHPGRAGASTGGTPR